MLVYIDVDNNKNMRLDKLNSISLTSVWKLTRIGYILVLLCNVDKPFKYSDHESFVNVENTSVI